MKKQTKVTVGITSGDFRGANNSSIQQAVDSLGEYGGVVEILEGTYECLDGIYMRSNVRLVGQGAKTVLRKCDGLRCALIIDADYGQLKVTPDDISGFRIGMGVSIADDISNAWAFTTAKIVGIKKGSLFIDTHLNKDYSVPENAFISNAFSLIKGYRCMNASVENLVIDGRKDTNDRMDGCRGGAIYWYKSENCSIVDCEVQDYNGDAISFQITRNISVIGCHATGNTSLGLHPGTGSENVRVSNCRFDNNDSGGFFLCWRVQDGVFEDILCENNRDFGISIGHKDTDNIFRKCIMKKNGNVGLRFREEREANGAHRNTWHNCVIEDNTHIGIEANGGTRDNTFENCTIRSCSNSLHPVAVVLKKNANNFIFNNCNIQGEINNLTD
ncbi:MAG: right-handed parallel beta-helix repeat-containing protein [Spirochaetales bacterium]|nr:right-handed parallel beta-helix repeat-containing protein [Spirochaetales bacterium]